MAALSSEEIVRFHAVLGASPGSSVSELKQAKLRLLQMVHPDKVHLDSLRDAVESHTKQINEAFEKLESWIGAGRPSLEAHGSKEASSGPGPEEGRTSRRRKRKKPQTVSAGVWTVRGPNALGSIDSFDIELDRDGGASMHKFSNNGFARVRMEWSGSWSYDETERRLLLEGRACVQIETLGFWGPPRYEHTTVELIDIRGRPPNLQATMVGFTPGIGMTRIPVDLERAYSA